MTAEDREGAAMTCDERLFPCKIPWITNLSFICGCDHQMSFYL